MLRKRRQCGFVLLVTLLLLALAAVVLQQLVSVSTRRAAEARRVRKDLQHRWAVTSFRIALLSRANQILKDEAKTETDKIDLPAELPQADQPDTEQPEIEQTKKTERSDNAEEGEQAESKEQTDNAEQGDEKAKKSDEIEPLLLRMDTKVTLGGQEFELTLYNEQAKANINTMYQQLGRQGVLRELHRLQARTSAPLRAFLQTARWTEEDSERFSAWEQVFDRFTPKAIFVSDDWNVPLADVLTCWSDGRLNIGCATPDAIRIVAGDILSTRQITQLIDDMTKPSKSPLADIWKAMKLSESDKKKLDLRLTDKSSAFGLLIRSRDDFKTRYEWNILRTDLKINVKNKEDNKAGFANFAPCLRIVWEGS